MLNPSHSPLNLLFIHGGPGLNAFMERGILAPLVEARGHRILTWNEPSKFRPAGTPFQPNGAYARWLSSVERALIQLHKTHGPVQVIGHSFGCLGIASLAQKHREKIERIVLLTPALDTYETHKNIIKIAISDFKTTKPEKAESMRADLKLSRESFDDSIQRALREAFEDSALLTHYWKDQACMAKCLSFMQVSEAQVDLDSFFAVHEDLHRNQREYFHLSQPISIPTLAVFGESDPVVAEKRETALVKRAFLSPVFATLKNTRHFAHLEAPQEFLHLLEQGIE